MNTYDLIIFMLFGRLLLDVVEIRRINKLRKGASDLFRLVHEAMEIAGYDPLDERHHAVNAELNRIQKELGRDLR